MFPGVKFGLANWQAVLSATQAQYAEVWFRLDWQEKYQQLFNYLNRQKINFGLHFWDTIDGKYFPSLLVPDQKIVQESFEKICQTIEIANKVGAAYVNFHPESYRLNLLDLDQSTIKTLDPDQPIHRKKGFRQLLLYLGKIKNLAQKLGVVPFLETVPKYAPSNFSQGQEDRLHLQKSEGLETEKYFILAKLGYPIALDIGHTLTQKNSQDPQVLFDYFFAAAKKILPSVGLIHITTNTAPHNGTDSHNGILPADFAAGAVPSKEQLGQLLALFKHRPVWLIPEPDETAMIENYFELKKIVEEIEKN